jgi:hypothetical protein
VKPQWIQKSEQVECERTSQKASIEKGVQKMEDLFEIYEIWYMGGLKVSEIEYEPDNREIDAKN